MKSKQEIEQRLKDQEALYAELDTIFKRLINDGKDPDEAQRVARSRSQAKQEMDLLKWILVK